MHRKVLGRGLETLIPAAMSTGTATLEMPPSGVQQLPLGAISSNPYQPRKRFDEDTIRELASSVRSRGVLQPIVVRQRDENSFQLVAGERRLRAASLAGLTQIPAIIRDVDDREMLEIALIENIQREDLNPLEEARAYQALIDKAQLTQAEVSERVGKQRASITNTLRLLLLPAEVQEMVSRETFTAGHARALLSLPNAGEQLIAARYVQAKGFSVRRTEAYIRRKLRRQHARAPKARAADLAECEIKLQQKFGTHVSIAPGRKGGKVVFEYYGREDLERLLEVWNIA
jgi:ParB family chromosome partitioning protein